MPNCCEASAGSPSHKCRLGLSVVLQDEKKMMVDLLYEVGIQISPPCVMDYVYCVCLSLQVEFARRKAHACGLSPTV